MKNKVLAKVANDCVPKSVTRAELNEAMRPVLDLLGVKAEHVLADGGFELRGDHVRLVVIAEATGPVSGLRMPLHLPAGREGTKRSIWSAAIDVEIENGTQ